MSFQKPPDISNNKIAKAGNILIDINSTDSDKIEARKILNQWRACHAYPINTFQATLRTKVRNDSFGNEAIIAQRLKRAPTIMSKLTEGRSNGISLSNMQDIAGVRAILGSVSDVRNLEKEYREKDRFQHILHHSKDYISEPKERDGYRSIHLIYKYKNKKCPDWDDLFIELQIRTKLQHSWATAVETMHTFLGKAIKTRQGQKKDDTWTEFFRLVSSAFAIMENNSPVSLHKNIKHTDLLAEIRKYERELKVIDKLLGLPFAMGKINNKAHYHLIILDVKNKTAKVESFGRDESEKANKRYEEIENESVKKEEIEAVLVSATVVEEAYPSFFANTKDFVENLRLVLKGDWAK